MEPERAASNYPESLADVGLRWIPWRPQSYSRRRWQYDLAHADLCRIVVSLRLPCGLAGWHWQVQPRVYRRHCDSRRWDQCANYPDVGRDSVHLLGDRLPL